jgi:hypothetical protein
MANIKLNFGKNNTNGIVDNHFGRLKYVRGND